MHNLAIPVGKFTVQLPSQLRTLSERKKFGEIGINMRYVSGAILVLSTVACLSSCGGSGSAETLTNASDRPSLSISSGNNQTGNIGQLLPIPVVVALLASNGTAISNASLEFRPAEGESQLIETDASGRASFDWQLGDAYDQQLQISYISTVYAVSARGTDLVLV